jgi:hypothetical protein
MSVSHSHCIFRFLLFISAVNVVGSQAIAATKFECSEDSRARTTADNKGPALHWTYLIVPAGPDAAEVSIDGFQTFIKLEATTAKKANGTSYIFSKYAPDTIHSRPEIKKGKELFVVSNTKSGGIQLSFRMLKPNLDKTTIECKAIESPAAEKR